MTDDFYKEKEAVKHAPSQKNNVSMQLFDRALFFDSTLFSSIHYEKGRDKWQYNECEPLSFLSHRQLTV